MKKILVAGIAAAAFCGVPAIAADIPVKGPAYKAAAPYDPWNGCYIGGNVGGGWNNLKGTDVALVGVAATVNSSSVVGGGQVGCDYQFSGPWVIGVQGQFDAVRFRGSSQFSGVGGAVVLFDSKISWLSTLTARLGYAVGPATLLYVKGGVAWSKDSLSLDTPAPVEFATDKRTGWTVSGGIEHKFWSNVSAFVEYNYIDLGTKTTTLVGAGVSDPIARKGNIQEVLVGINFRFGDWGKSPVVAKY